MIALIDSTILFHLYYHHSKMVICFNEKGITEIITTRINYLEILSGASENTKTDTRKFLSRFELLEFNAKAAKVASKLAMQYRVGSKQHKDFLIASIAVANKIPLLTENTKDFTYKELEVIPYSIQQKYDS